MPEMCLRVPRLRRWPGSRAEHTLFGPLGHRINAASGGSEMRLSARPARHAPRRIPGLPWSLVGAPEQVAGTEDSGDPAQPAQGQPGFERVRTKRRVLAAQDDGEGRADYDDDDGSGEPEPFIAKIPFPGYHRDEGANEPDRLVYGPSDSQNEDPERFQGVPHRATGQGQPEPRQPPPDPAGPRGTPP